MTVDLLDLCCGAGLAADGYASVGIARDEEHGRHVMGSRRLLPWDSLKEGFPPAYTAHVGADLLIELDRRARA